MGSPLGNTGSQSRHRFEVQMTALDEIKCPGCGANLGAESPTHEYTCPYCGHVSHARLVKPAYGIDFNAVFAQDAARDAQARAAAEQSQAAARQQQDELVAVARRSSALPAIVLGVASVLAGAGLEMYALASGARGVAVAGALPVALGGVLLLVGANRRAA